MKALLISSSLALLGVTGALLYQLHSRAAPVVTASSAAPVAASASTAVPNVRAQIRQAVQSEVTPLNSERDVDRYLEDLTARARRQHQVTALEVEPGIQAIGQLTGRIGGERTQEKLIAFTNQMAKLSAELDPPAPPDDLDDLARRIERARGDERGALIRRFQQAAQSLAPDRRMAQLERLNAWAAPSP